MKRLSKMSLTDRQRDRDIRLSETDWRLGEVIVSEDSRAVSSSSDEDVVWMNRAMSQPS